MLGMAFEAEGFCVVAGPDVVWGRDIRAFHPPADRFDGIVGGDPCQSHSSLANLVRAKGLEPRFGDLSPEFARVVEEAQPAWFLRENVPAAPDIAPAGYAVHPFLLDNAWLDAGDGFGEEQMRRRRFWFGVRGEVEPVDLRRWIQMAAFGPLRRAQSVTGRHPGEIGVTGGHRGSPGRYSLEEMMRLQGLPESALENAPFTMQAKRKLVGNGVPLSMGRALAQAVKAAVEERA